MNNGKLGLSCSAAAAALGVDQCTLIAWRDRGLIAHHKVPGRKGGFSYWFPREALDAFRRATFVPANGSFADDMPERPPEKPGNSDSF